MSDGFIIEVTDDGVTPALTSLDQALSNDNIGFWLDVTADPYLKRRIEARFASEGDSAVGKWADLSDYTVARRESLGYPGEHPILVNSGELEKYLVNTAGNINETPDGVTLSVPGEAGAGKLEVKVAVHQKGSRKNRTPARPMLAVDEIDAEMLLSSLTNHLMESLRGDFL